MSIQNTHLKKILIILLLLPVLAKAQVATINTYAGNGTAYSGGDGGLALSSGIRFPVGLTFDQVGNLLVAHDSLIRKIDKVTGIITTIAGSTTATTYYDGMPATSALFIGMNATNVIAVDKNGDLYIADQLRIKKVNMSTGIINTYAGTGGTGGTGDGGPATAATFGALGGLCIDTVSGYLYIADDADHRVRKINMATGVITACAGSGVAGYSGDGGLAAAATLREPRGLCADKYGNLYIGDRYSNAIRKVSAATGTITTIAGTGIWGDTGDGGPATSAHIGAVRAISVDTCGNVYFSAENKVRFIDETTGIINTLAGGATSGFWGDGGPAWSALLRAAIGVLADNAGKFYIADGDNHRVRLVTIPPTGGTPSITTASTTIYAGSATFTATVTGGVGVGVGYQWYVNGVLVPGATNATFTYPPATGDSIKCLVTSGGHCNGIVVSYSNTLVMTVIPVGAPTISITSATAIVCPNPAHDEIQITSSHPIQKIEVLNLLGQKLLQRHANSSTERIDISILSRGVYIVSIEMQGQKIVTRLVKE